MAGLALLVRRSLRSNRKAILGLALVLALGGGVALAALAGSRRTASAFPRYLRDSDATEVAVNVFGPDESGKGSFEAGLALGEEARRIDGVVGDATYIGLETMFVVDAAGRPVSFGIEVVGSLDGRFIETDRVAVREGRVPREDRIDEVFVNESTAAGVGLEVGDEVMLAAYDHDFEGDPEAAPPVGEEAVTVVGIGLFPDEVLADDFDRSGRLLTSPALTRRYLSKVGSYSWQGLQLERDGDIGAVIADYEELAGSGRVVIVQRTDEQIEAVQRAIRPVVVAIATFGALALAAALALGGLAGVRIATDGANDAQTFRAIGLHPRQSAVAIAAPAIAGAVLGGLGAVAVAVALSPLAPVGSVRSVDPRRGIDLDLAVVVPGAAVVVLVLCVVAFIAGLSSLRPKRPAGSARVGLAGALASTGAPPAAVIGVRHAVHPSGDGGRVPVRSTLLAGTVSVVAVVSALLFGSNVRALLDDPARYGWSPDLAISSGGGYEDLDPAGAAPVVADPAVDALALAGYVPVALSGISVNAMGVLAVEGAAPITIVDGRLPGSTSEVALGAVTARRLGVSTGDEVETDAGGRLEVTGTVALPAIGQAAAAHPSLGQGAVLTLDGLRALDDGAYPVMALIDLADGAETARDGERLKGLVAEHMTELPAEAASVYRDLRPGDISGLEPAQATANALAVLVAVAAVLAVVLTLASSVRHRSATFATLRAIGFDGRQLRSCVRWQTNSVLAGALLVGGSLGVVVGRLGWIALAQDLGTATTPVVPILFLVLVGVVLVLAVHGAGEHPARRAARASVRSLRDRR